MHFVIHAVDKPGIIATRAKHFRAHRVHLDESARHGVDIFTAGSLVADDGETPVALLIPPLMVTAEVYDIAPDVSAERDDRFGDRFRRR